MSWNICKHPECESYTARPDGDYCESCRRANAKEEENNLKSLSKRATQLEKAKAKNQVPRAKISKVSPKREEINKEYFKLVEQFKIDEPLCKAKVNEYCTEKTDDPHHRKGRGIYLLMVDSWLPVCRNCHIYITNHPEEAIRKGWSESRLAKQEPHKI